MSTINQFSVVCPTDCTTTLQLPILDAEQNCTPIPKKSQICDLYIKPNTATVTPVSGWTDGVYTITPEPTNINNADVTGTAVKWLVGEGGVAEPSETVVELAKFVDVVSEREFVLEFVVKNLSDAQYDFGRAIQCGNTDFTFWYSSPSYTYGSATGIVPTSAKAVFPKGAGRDDVDQMTLRFTFKSITDPDRKANPFA